MTRPLDGTTVLALEHVIAAPLATRQLADLGARVIKIERPGGAGNPGSCGQGGDQARGYDRRVRGLSSHFVWVNRGKESLTLDLKHPAAAGVIERLLERADVLVQNLAPGAAARLGLDFEALQSLEMDDLTWGWTLQMQLRARHRHLRTLEIPLPHTPRRAGRSKISGTLMGSIRAGTTMLRTVVRERRVAARHRTDPPGSPAGPGAPPGPAPPGAGARSGPG